MTNQEPETYNSQEDAKLLRAEFERRMLASVYTSDWRERIREIAWDLIIDHPGLTRVETPMGYTYVVDDEDGS